MASQHWPHAGQRVDVHITEDAALRAVVDDVRPPEQLHLRLPVQRDGAPPPDVPVGATVALMWTSSAGQHLLTSTLVDRPSPGVPLWKLAPDSEPVVAQRRDFVRVAEARRLTLQRGDDRPWIAAVCDLSEGGIRCVVREANDLRAGDALQLVASLEGRDLELPAVVLAVEQVEDRTTLRLQFSAVGRHADVLRRHVLEQQQRARTVGGR